MKKQLKRYMLSKIVMATDAAHALKKDKTTPVLDVQLVDVAQADTQSRLQVQAVGFTAPQAEEDEDEQ